ncbi:MAG: DUF4493 domain-containing protein [Flavobacteriales bacterium]|nr:DUF4493 domain-containing protein [Flavobacteriales bacterium]
MKRIAQILIATATLALSVVSCEKTAIKPEETKEGTFSLNLKAEGDFVTVSNTKAATKATPTLADFAVELKNVDGSYYKKWDSYTSIPEIVSLPADNYTITAANGTLKEAAWEAPYFLGSRNFTVSIQELSSVQLICKLANVKVTMGFSQEFLSQLKEVKAVVSNGASGILEFSSTETRAGYFSVPSDGVLTVTVIAKRVSNDATVQETLRLTEVEARQWHKINVGVATSGSSSFELTIDDSLIEKDDDVFIPDGDDIIDNGGDDGNWGDDTDPTPPTDPDEKAAPSITGASFNGTAFDITKAVNIATAEADGCTLDVRIKTADNTVTIQNLFVTINAPTIPDVMLEELGLLGEFDMANLDPTSTTYSTLSNDPINLIDPSDPVKGKNDYTFSVGKFMSMLAGLGTGTNQFNIRVVDSNAKTSSATLTVNITEY